MLFKIYRLRIIATEIPKKLQVWEPRINMFLIIVKDCCQGDNEKRINFSLNQPGDLRG